MFRKAMCVAATGTLLALQGCVAQHGVRPLRPLEVATAPYQDMVATSMTGSLMYEGNCLLFRDEATRQLSVPVWPSGSTFNGTSVTFHHPGKAEQRLVIGEELVIEGVASQWASLPGDQYDRFRAQCRAAPFFVRRVGPAN